jgi:mxaA protein
VARGALEAMQPDIAPVRTPLAPTLARLAGYAALALLLAWPWLQARWPQLAIWRRDAPLRAAWRDLRALRLSDGDDEQALRRACARLHAAFDATAGSAVFAQQLEPLYRARPSLRGAAHEIDAFFAASRQAFFAPAGGAANDYSLARLRALSLTLARLEAASR